MFLLEHILVVSIEMAHGDSIPNRLMHNCDIHFEVMVVTIMWEGVIFVNDDCRGIKKDIPFPSCIFRT